MTRVVHCKKESYDEYIGRPSELGNPFSHLPGTLANFRVDDREKAVSLFEVYARERIKNDPLFAALIRRCYGKTLGCWCKPKACHGDVIAGRQRPL